MDERNSVRAKSHSPAAKNASANVFDLLIISAPSLCVEYDSIDSLCRDREGRATGSSQNADL